MSFSNSGASQFPSSAAPRPFADRQAEVAALDRFWEEPSAQCIPVVGRRRVGKTYLLEHFAAGKRHVYHRCNLQGTEHQLARLGAAIAEATGDPVLRAQPPSTWEAVFAAIERLAVAGRLLLIVDEVPYWVAKDDSVPSVLQNWWDARGRYLDLMLVLCGSAVQMMEKLLTGPAPLAGCVTGRLRVHPFDFRAAAEMTRFTDPVDALTAYGILGGVPLYLSYLRPDRSLSENVLHAIASPTARLYVEPMAVFAAHHESYNREQALAVLRAIANRQHHWSAIEEATKLRGASLSNVMDRLVDDLGLVERLLPVTEVHQTRAYRTQYRLVDNFFRFWFRFIEPNQDHIEFGHARRVVDAIFAEMSEFMGSAFEDICRDWVRLASAAGALPVRVWRVGTWWDPSHDVDVVGLDAARRVALTGECTWTTGPFGGRELETYLGHVRALGDRVRPEAAHALFCKTGFTEPVRAWAAQRGAVLCTPADLLAAFGSVETSSVSDSGRP
ncbi:MAG TPA: ATP-binding protein [Chloroflexota bacterium]|nr:ATP-binding protein [Chloroflexota bacterium]